MKHGVSILILAVSVTARELQFEFATTSPTVTPVSSSAIPTPDPVVWPTFGGTDPAPSLAPAILGRSGSTPPSVGEPTFDGGSQATAAPSLGLFGEPTTGVPSVPSTKVPSGDSLGSATPVMYPFYEPVTTGAPVGILSPVQSPIAPPTFGGNSTDGNSTNHGDSTSHGNSTNAPSGYQFGSPVESPVAQPVYPPVPSPTVYPGWGGGATPRPTNKVRIYTPSPTTAVPTVLDDDGTLDEGFGGGFEDGEQTEAPYVPPPEDEDPLNGADDDEKVEDNWQKKGEKAIEDELEAYEKDKRVRVVAIVMSSILVFALLLTAQQALNNPDGLCASICRLLIKLLGCICRLVCLPCTLCCGSRAGHVRGTQHKPMSIPESEFRANEMDMI